MEIILLENVERLGQLGDVVSVRAGYARNHLIPAGKARYATEENLAEVRAKRAKLEQQAQALLEAAQTRRDALQNFAVTVTVEVNPDGKLFGSVGPAEIAAAVGDAGQQLERREIRLPDGPLRTVGTHAVTVHLHVDVETEIQVTVEPSDVVAALAEDEAPKPKGEAPKPEGEAPEPESETPKLEGEAPKPEGEAPKPEGAAPERQPADN